MYRQNLLEKERCKVAQENQHSSLSKVINREKFDNSWYKPGPFWKRTLWHYVSLVFFESGWFPFYKIKGSILKLFGAKVGKDFGIKPCVKIKYPWFLELGDHVRIGEAVWIDNLAKVTLKDNVTLSQGAMLITGNHNYKSEGFDLMTAEITVNEGAWLCSMSRVGPGVVVGRNAILSLSAVTTQHLKEDGIYAGNPAVLIKSRVIE